MADAAANSPIAQMSMRWSRRDHSGIFARSSCGLSSRAMLRVSLVRGAASWSCAVLMARRCRLSAMTGAMSSSPLRTLRSSAMAPALGKGCAPLSIERCLEDGVFEYACEGVSERAWGKVLLRVVRHFLDPGRKACAGTRARIQPLPLRSQFDPGRGFAPLRCLTRRLLDRHDAELEAMPQFGEDALHREHADATLAPDAVLDSAEVGLVDAGALGQRFLRHAMRFAQGPQGATEREVALRSLVAGLKLGGIAGGLGKRRGEVIRAALACGGNAEG